MLRSFVTFFAELPLSSQPLGRELAEYLADALRRAGLQVSDPERRENWAWTIRSEQTLREVEIVAGKAHGAMNAWLVTLDAHVSLAFGLVGGEDADEVRDETLRPYCLALDRALKADARFHQVRWYTQEEFDARESQSG